MDDFPTLIQLVSNPALATAIVTLIANGLAKVWGWDRRITATVDSSKNRTAVSLDASS